MDPSPPTHRTVTVTFLGFLGRLTGTRQTEVALEERATVADLLAALAGRYGSTFAEAIFRVPGEAHTHLRVFLGNEEAALGDALMADGAGPATVRVLVVPGFEGGSR